MSELVPLRRDFEYRTQKRKAQAKSVWNQKQIAGADFETKDGFPHIFTWTIFDGTEYIDRHFLFGGTKQDPYLFLEANGGKEHTAFDIETLCNILCETGNYSEGGHGKRQKPQEMYFFNLGYDATAILKTLHSEAIDHLILGDAGIIDTHTWNLEPMAQRIKIKNPNYGRSRNGQRKDKRKNIQVWVIGDEEDYELMPFNRYIQVSYLPKKHLCLEPLKYYTKGVKWAKTDCWDIRPFCGGGSLNTNARKHLDDTKLDFTEEEMGLLGSLSAEGIQFTIDNWDKILEYAEKDSSITARLAWKIVNGFEINGVRMKRPYSPASVAERACLDRCNIPKMNTLIAERFETCLAAWSSYSGGWFESVGSGVWGFENGQKGVQAFDITSAYPHVMWWLPDVNNGVWVGTFEGDPESECWDYLNRTWNHYSLSYFEAEVIFPEGLNIYPAAMKSESAGCLMNPRIVYGWFTGDEIKEFEKWDAEINIERWAAFIPLADAEEAPDVEEGIRYPFRPFIQHFYGNKLEQDLLKGTPEYDDEIRNINKLMICSLYGKNVQAIEKHGVRVTGQLWNPFYASIITAGCRARMGEMIRINGDDSILAVNTDGLIFKAADGLKVAENPMPVFFDGERVNLGDWDNDGEGILLLMMSGVYSIIKGEIAKTTYRGSYSMFIDHRDENNELRSDLYGEDWLSFCRRYENERTVSRNAEINPTMRPYTLGEAKVRSNYQLANIFRIVDLTISACGDSVKRKWEIKPETFNDLAVNWWPSGTWEELV